jgi:hypothetical protein
VAVAAAAAAAAAANAATDLKETRDYEKQHLMNENDFDECWMPWATPSAADDSASQIEAMCT